MAAGTYQRAEESVGDPGERKAPEAFEKNPVTQIAYGKFYTAANLPAGLGVDRINCPAGAMVILGCDILISALRRNLWDGPDFDVITEGTSIRGIRRCCSF